MAYGEETGAELIYNSRHSGTPEQYTLYDAEWRDDRYGRYNDALLSQVDKAALYEYLSNLRMQSIAGNYSYEQEGEALYLAFDIPNGGALWVELYSRYAALYGRSATAECYYLLNGADWEALRACAPGA